MPMHPTQHSTLPDNTALLRTITHNLRDLRHIQIMRGIHIPQDSHKTVLAGAAAQSSPFIVRPAPMPAESPSRSQSAPMRPLAVGDVVQCFEDPMTQQSIEGDCILISKSTQMQLKSGHEMWRVRFAADGIDGPVVTRCINARNRYTQEGA